MTHDPVAQAMGAAHLQGQIEQLNKRVKYLEDKLAMAERAHLNVLTDIGALEERLKKMEEWCRDSGV